MVTATTSTASRNWDRFSDNSRILSRWNCSIFSDSCNLGNNYYCFVICVRSIIIFKCTVCMQTNIAIYCSQFIGWWNRLWVFQTVVLDWKSDQLQLRKMDFYNTVNIYMYCKHILKAVNFAGQTKDLECSLKVDVYASISMFSSAWSWQWVTSI